MRCRWNSAITCAVVLMTCGAAIGAQGKPRIAVQRIDATPAVMARSEGDGSGVANVLEQILQGADGELVHALQGSGLFEVTAGSDLTTVLDAQDLQDSGLYDERDPQRARPFELAGFKYIATVTVNNFQMIDRRSVIPDAFGDSTYIFETIQLSAVVRIYDVTKGTILVSTNMNSEHTQETRIIPGASQDGSFSSRMIGDVTRDFAMSAATAVLDLLSPATVMEFSDGRIWFDRGRNTGVAVGDVYAVRDQGRIMHHPRTGDVVGASDVRNGWAVVTEVFPAHAVAEAVSLSRQPTIGRSTMKAADALPDTLNAGMRATGPFAAPLAGPSTSDTSPENTEADSREERPADRLFDHPATIALFVDSTAEAIPADRVSTLERQLQGLLSRAGIRIVSRRDVLNAVGSLNSPGANAGTGEPDQTRAERLLSDQASVLALAKLLNADAIVTATITSLITDVTQTEQIERIVARYTIDVSWSMLSGATGISVDGGIVQAGERFHTSPSRDRTEFNVVDRLLRDDAERVAAAVHQSLASGHLATLELATSRRNIGIVAVLENMTVPEIRRINGVWTMTGTRYPLSLDACMVSIDGVLVGSTPGPIAMSEGGHRLRLEHPLCDTVDRFVPIDDTTGSLRIPIVLSAEGRADFEQQTAFFEKLKDGAALRENEQALVLGLVDFLKRSSITIDTSQVRNLGIGQPSIWLQNLE